MSWLARFGEETVRLSTSRPLDPSRLHCISNNGGIGKNSETGASSLGKIKVGRRGDRRRNEELYCGLIDALRKCRYY
jgi:hypothetical protein